MPLSPDDATAILARETTRTFLDCLTISGDGLETRRLVNNTDELVRSAGTYTPCGFKGEGPDDTDTMNPGMTITVEDVDRETINLLKTYTGIPVCVFETVTAEAPDTVVHGPYSFVIKDVQSDLIQIQINIGYQEDFFNQQVPKDSWTPSNSPGMYP